jgi:hypothetical protein
MKKCEYFTAQVDKICISRARPRIDKDSSIFSINLNPPCISLGYFSLNTFWRSVESGLVGQSTSPKF